MKNIEHSEEINKNFNVEQEDKNWEELLKVINSRAKKFAKINFLEKDIPIIYDWPSEINGLSDLDRDNYEKNYLEISVVYENELPKLFAYANLIRQYVCHVGAAEMKLKVEHEIYPDNEYTRMCSTPEGYVGNERVTPGFMREISGKNINDDLINIRNAFRFSTPPDEINLLKALDCIWLKIASEDFLGTDRVFLALAEARMAAEIVSCLSMLRITKIGNNEEIVSEIKSSIARDAALVRHAKSNNDRVKVVKKYQTSKDAFTSKDAAAIAFTKDFPYEFSTIRAWLKNA